MHNQRQATQRLHKRDRRAKTIKINRTKAHLSNQKHSAAEKRKAFPKNNNGEEKSDGVHSLGFGGRNTQAIFTPRRKKLKGFQKDSTGKKVA